SQKYAEHVRRHGIKQFIHIYNKNKDRIDRCFKWGDEIEYVIVKFDHKSKRVRLSLRAKDILKVMDEREEREGPNRQVLWRPECAAYQIEGTPGQPFGYNNENNDKQSANNWFNNVENNMRERRRDIDSLLEENEALLCFTNFPRFGCNDTTVPFTKPGPEYSFSGSLFLSDEVICPLYNKWMRIEQYWTERTGHRIAINAPIFKDTHTPDPFVQIFNDQESQRAAKVDHIYMDSNVFGAACCCLQVTLQAFKVDEALVLNDQLAPLAPIMMALSASTPIFRGYLTDRDGRWDVLSSSCDDRTAEESGEKPLKHNKYRIYKPRFASINTYLCESNAKYNDNPIVYNKEYYDEMINAGIPPLVAQHIAYLFIRDPMVIYRDTLDQNDETDSGHFETLQSTNWQTMRFKPPPTNQPSIGWRVEFRPMDIQMTDFENAAYAVFVVLLSRIILKYKLNFIIPISKVDENMSEAQKRDAINRSKFWFRKDIFSSNESQELNNNSNPFCETHDFEEESYIQMTINEIINGYGQEFPGLVPIMKEYVKSISLDAYTSCKVQQYIQLIADRASAKLQTNAQWIRHFVRKHNDYKY
ncbi:unnamed protein product, partial [Oppiella nova]